MDMKQFEDILSAITFAEAGEHEKAKEILQEKKTVLLAISDVLFDKNVLKYALNISKRIGAGIDILYLTKSEAQNAELDEFISKVEKEDVRCKVIYREGCMKKAILDYTEKRGDVLFVIVGSTPELDIECKVDEKTLSDAWKRMRCPLVVVSKSAMPSPA